MGSSVSGSITTSIRAACAGDRDAREVVAGAFWSELHARARRAWRRSRLPQWIGQPSSCVADAIMRTFAQHRTIAADRDQFRATLILMLERVLADARRVALARKRDALRLDPAVAVACFPDPSDDRARVEVREWLELVAASDREGLRMLEMWVVEGRSYAEIGALLLRSARQVQYRIAALVARCRSRGPMPS